MEEVTYTIQLEALENGGFAVSVPTLPGCVTWGSSFDHAVAMAREAIELWIENKAEDGEPIPNEQGAARPVKLGIQVRRPALS